jgi:hypothetical protein
MMNQRIEHALFDDLLSMFPIDQSLFDEYATMVLRTEPRPNYDT